MRAWPMDTPFNVADLSLQPPASFPELYQELWWYSGSYVTQTAMNTSASSSYLLQKGALGQAASSSSATKLYTFSSSWPASTKCAFEAWFCADNAGFTVNAALWDLTSNSVVSGSQISTTSNGTLTYVRSGQFTLTPGHSYGITTWVSASGAYVHITDASLIIFPPAGSVSPSLSSISLANPSGGSLKEEYYPLWIHSSGTFSTAITGTASAYLQKGTTTAGTPLSAPTKLHTLNSNWNTNQKFALEVSIYTSASGGTAYASLADITSNVTLTTVSTTSPTATVLRTATLTLTPSHSYGVYVYTNNASYTAYLTKAHLVALGG